MWTSVNFDVRTKIDVNSCTHFCTKIDIIKWSLRCKVTDHFQTDWSIFGQNAFNCKTYEIFKKYAVDLEESRYQKRLTMYLSADSFFFSNLISGITLNSNAGLFGSSTATYCLWPDEAGACCPTGAGPSGTTGAGSGGANIAPASAATTGWAFDPLKINSI